MICLIVAVLGGAACGRLWFEPLTDAGAAWPDADGAACRRKLTFDSATLAEALERFPALVVLNETRIDYARMQSSGGDLRFTAADGVTSLAHEIESWDPPRSSTVWVDVPVIEGGGADEHVWMYYGDPDATDTPLPSAVWDPGYEAVWHLADDPESAPPQIRDSTAKARHGTSMGAMTSSARTTGRAGSALTFDGVDDRVDVGAVLGDRVAFTASLWFRTASATVPMKAWGEGNSTSNGPLYFLAVNESVAGDVETCVRTMVGGGGCPNHFGGYHDGAWHQLVVVQRARDDRELFVDGVSRGVDMTLVPPGTRDTGALGAMPRVVVDFYFAGELDEIRLSGVARSSASIAADHRSMLDTFITFGAEDCR